jgi:glycine betaine catabolism A
MSVDGSITRGLVRRTLAGHYYRDPNVFRFEFDQVFSRTWFCVGRTEAVGSPRCYFATEIVDQPIVILRDREGILRAFHNVCRHRGTLLLDLGGGPLRDAIKCPYHAWVYGLDGRLLGTPYVRRDEIEREKFGLIPIRVAEWQGCLFVNLSGDAPPLQAWLDEQNDMPRRFEKWNLGDLRVARTTTYEVAANWKILIENYEECLHCPGVHPELVKLIPAYRTGASYEDRDDYGVSIAKGSRALTASGTTSLPALPGLSAEEASCYYGAYIFPNAWVDVAGPYAALTTIIPRAADRSTLITDYLFAPETMAEEGFDPSDVIDFNELVLRQDNAICERVQRGVTSRAFKHGVYPDKDSGPHDFDQFYTRVLGSTPVNEMDTLGRTCRQPERSTSPETMK